MTRVPAVVVASDEADVLAATLGDTMVWRKLPARREQVVREHDDDWYVDNDADEFREAPWPTRPGPLVLLSAPSGAGP